MHKPNKLHAARFRQLPARNLYAPIAHTRMFQARAYTPGFAGISFSEYFRNLPDAVRYADLQMKDPEMKAIYESRGRQSGKGAYAAAFSDYLVTPTIKKVDATKYTGAVGQVIRVRACDDFMVTSVSILIINAAAELIERGAAFQVAGTDRWNYTITAWNESLAGCKIIVSAHDLAGNVTSQSLTLT